MYDPVISDFKDIQVRRCLWLVLMLPSWLRHCLCLVLPLRSCLRHCLSLLEIQHSVDRLLDGDTYNYHTKTGHTAAQNFSGWLVHYHDTVVNSNITVS